MIYKYIFISIVVFTLFFRYMHLWHDQHDFALRYFHTFSVIGDMAIGGLMAYYCSFENKILNILHSCQGCIFLFYTVQHQLSPYLKKIYSE